MSTRTIERTQAFINKMKELNKIGDEFDAACAEEVAASKRRNDARSRYAQCFAEIEAEFPEERLPYWVESVFGSKPAIAASQAAEERKS
ncbi:hypothetical protein [Pandoraea pnomenusa]|uniref:hypothetical protein n=1 Tax=Pandoraea pnomenusa TaxID=93220 RepID=UPI0007BCCAD9|nr:hypothetical protein [Pandoraea pnomenusa]ANC43006.1 hypothetical protein A6P55_00670 [Pandoraea pnomenusa]